MALESTIISHGMPYPKNLEVARDLESIVRSAGAVPATIAIMHGVPTIGLTADQLHVLAKDQKQVIKASTRDLAYVTASGKMGATTVASTMRLAHLAGIKVFATGGIGGVHRGAESTMDVSTDLIELGRVPVAVVCAGIKSILDIPKSLEVLETQGVPVIGFQTQQFPSFFTNTSGMQVHARADSPGDVARMLFAQDVLCPQIGSVIAVPNPTPADPVLINLAIQEALAEADRRGIAGNAITPFLLEKIEALTRGQSLSANIALVRNNVRVATAIAMEYALMKTSSSDHSSNKKSLHFGPSASKSSISDPAAAATTTTAAATVQRSQQGRSYDAVVVGGAVVDMIGTVVPSSSSSALPSSQPTILGSSNPGKVVTSFGGVGRNIAANMAQHNVRTALVTAVGDDLSGHNLLKHAESCGIDVQHVKIVSSTNVGTSSAKTSETPRTAVYQAIHDHNGDLCVGVADMDIFQHVSPAYLDQLNHLLTPQHCLLVVSDGNLSVPSFRHLSQLCRDRHLTLCFEPTSDHKCLLPLHAEALDAIDIIKPNVSELCTMLRFAVSSKRYVQQYHTINWLEVRSQLDELAALEEQQQVAALYHSVNAREQRRQNRLEVLGYLTSVLWELMSSSASGRPPAASTAITGKHVLLSMGAEGVLWCGPAHIDPKARNNGGLGFGNGNRLPFVVLRFPAQELSPAEIVNTNGAGDAFFAGFLRSLIEDVRQASGSADESLQLLPRWENIRDGLRSAEKRLRESK